MDKTIDVVSAGLHVMDVIASPVTEAVFLRDTLYLEHLNYSVGGDALNAAVNMSRLGLRVASAGLIGDDAAGRTVERTLKACGVDTACLGALPGEATATSIVLCEPGGERHFAYYPGANRLFDGACLEDQLLAATRMLYIGSVMALAKLEGDPLSGLFRRAKSLGVITAMDCTHSDDGVWLPKIEGALPYTDVFIPSRDEAFALTGMGDERRAARFLRERGVAIAGVKLGERGVFLSYADQEIYVPAYACADVVDTTGAGDAFCSGFLVGLLRGDDPPMCARIGSAVALQCIRYFGATTHGCTFEQALALVNENGEDRFDATGHD